MKGLWIVLALFAVVGARSYQNWGNYYNGPGFGRGGNHGSHWGNPPQQNYPDIEWVCRSQKTSDMMIIAVDNTQQQHPNRGPWWQNVPPGHQNGQHWNPPIFIIQDPTKIDVDTGNSQTPSPSTTETNVHNNNNNQPQTTPKYNGGEGLIDIRMRE